jgi:biopolymer transport protein ExbD
MSFIPEEELRSKTSLNLAPIIDFLFLMLMFFATLAVSRMTTKDTDIELVEVKPEAKASFVSGNSDYNVIHISINADGNYKWVTELRDYPFHSPEEIKQELIHQYEANLLPEDKSMTQILLKIDKNAKWEPILKAIFAIREAGFEIHPVYEPEDLQNIAAEA